ncbi:AEC family transporter [Plastorhodobacter daqingensis]|uniref:AEC family transporter n=1 Tax=Plastorhodobacter daqingensis TaxID=1387281 RepID=A0ABW2URR7_9RHOB
MLAALLIVLPVFALILAGWLAGRTAVFGPHATAEINRFVVWLALPALLFHVVATADWNDLRQPGFIASFTISAALSMALALIISVRRTGNLVDGAIDGLNAGYANIGFVGFPIVLVALGPEALVPATIGSIITMCVIFAAAIVLIEIGRQDEARPLRLAIKVAVTLIRNPVLVAPAVATVFPLTGLVLPAPAETFLRLLGGAAAPCALVALGLFVASNRPGGDARYGATVFLIVCKLLLHPLLAWILARFVFDLSTFATQAVVLLAALPAGTGSFMLAELYRRDAAVSSRTIIGSTLLSVLTITLLVSAMPYL